LWVRACTSLGCAKHAFAFVAFFARRWRGGMESAMCAAVTLPPHLRWAGLNTKWRIYRCVNQGGVNTRRFLSPECFLA
jgi:hypothetical protein